MSNRQARRELSRTQGTRPQRTPRASAPPPRRTGGGGSEIFTRPFVLIVAAVIVVLGAILVAVVATSGGGSSDDIASRLREKANDLPTDLANGMKLGKDDAPVKLTVYADFQCPFCLKFTGEQEIDIIEEFVKPGIVQLEYQNLPILGPESVRAALAGMCAADQNKFWEYHNKLFLVQAEAGQIDDEKLNVGRFSDENLKKYAVELGLDTEKFNQCLESSEHLDEVTEQQRTASSFGIRGTPGFLVNGQPLGAGTPANMDAWRSLFQQVQAQLATATAQAGSTATPEASPTGAASPAPTPTNAP
ncbi:DsbA family protein [Tepidiforma thermophila]|uniref:Protein-disulfide isomerase n=1 Tax=Tepidiforma thermophila (strain KCTC 52669 / CGMCC 1.13589 / G233) TaxID=2761530 RepID=A0A2A9HFM4_TEPT2|nr:thioredoxin domain-containing protein [Tepidiforma thermophila]PFG73599.1 protein-disulfide isomerase [Tepidiforma thermophila]